MMKTRLLVRLLTLTSWLPLAACASSDEGDIQPGSVGGGGAPAPRSEDENLNASINGSLNVNSANVGLDDDLNVNNNASGNKNNANLEADNEGGDSNFDDMENEGNGAAVAAAGPLRLRSLCLMILSPPTRFCIGLATKLMRI
ncbi:MAG: hypothetical protein EOP07_07275 [Proteobacteria bacterium]|nr:MAG: hypothetical protein EOP07_07275 [Pseudomonadota bacterium]